MHDRTYNVDRDFVRKNHSTLILGRKNLAGGEAI
jgi:hypothetical protein